MIPLAEQAGIYLTIENIFANGYLLSPQEMVEFVDSFGHERVRILFDTGNIMQYQFPEHWIPILGRRIQNVHFKEYNKRSNEFNLESFRTLLDGTTNWPAVMTRTRRDRLSRLSDVRILPSLPALARSLDLSDFGGTRPDARRADKSRARAGSDLCWRSRLYL